MTREEQDKNWAEHSKEVRQDIIERYNSYDTSVPVLKALKESLEYAFGKHNLQSSLIYEDVARELFNSSVGIFGIPERDFSKESDVKPWDYFGVYSKEAQQKVIAIIKLLNVAKFLNKNEDGSDWVPTIEDWDDIDSDFFTLGIDPAENKVHVVAINKLRFSTEIVYFRTEELAKQAVQILGEDVVRTALGNY